MGVECCDDLHRGYRERCVQTTGHSEVIEFNGSVRPGTSQVYYVLGFELIFGFL